MYVMSGDTYGCIHRYSYGHFGRLERRLWSVESRAPRLRQWTQGIRIKRSTGHTHTHTDREQHFRHRHTRGDTYGFMHKNS